MKQISTYQFFSKSIIYLLLIGQLWTNAVSYRQWMIDSDLKLIELCCCDESESGEEDNKKEKADKYRMGLYTARFGIGQKVINILHSEGFRSLHHPEITTPPPESFFLL